MASTFEIEDFENPPISGNFRAMKTVSREVEIIGAGMIHWMVINDEGELILLRVPGYYVPKSDQKLLSPQQYSVFHQWSSV